MMKAIGYIRVSTEIQALGGVSLDAQRAKLEAYAVAMDLELVRVEVDAGVSAKSLDRPGLGAALAALEADEASALLIPKLDRLTRSVSDLGVLIGRYFESRFALISVADSINTSTAAGRLVLNVLVSVSQWEREAVGERTSVAMQHMIRVQGVKVGRAPYGWRYADQAGDDGRRQLVRIPAEQAVIARVRGELAAGSTQTEVARDLNADGIKTQRGGRWTQPMISRVVKQPRSQPALALVA